MIRLLTSCLAGLWLLLLAALSAAQEPVVIGPDDTAVVIGRHMAYIRDPGGLMTIEEAASEGLASSYVPSPGDSLNFGFSSSAYWVRFRIRGPSTAGRSFLLEVGSPIAEHVDLYIPGEQGEFEVMRSGVLVPMEERAVKSLRPAFPLTLTGPPEKTYYLRYRHRGSVPISLTLWDNQSYVRNADRERYSLGIYYGAMAIMLVYNALLYLSIRMRAYLFYVAYVLSYILWQLAYNGLLHRLVPQFPGLMNHAVPMLICTTGITALQFSRTALGTAKTVPRMDRFMRGLMGGFGIVILVSLQPNRIISLLLAAFLATVFAFTVLISTFMCLRQGNRTARIFLVAWFMLLCGTALLGLKSLGVLPSIFLTEYGQQIGSIFEIVLLSLALAEQVNVMRKEKEKAQAEALAAQQSANLRLEEEVRARTSALEESNSQLAALSSKLSKYLSPQVHQSISLGQTDAGQRSARKFLTVFFSDIQDFTGLTESLEPEKLTEILNTYFSDMAEIALRHGGTIDKFAGDAILIFFGDPDTRGRKEDAQACIEMALEMQDHIRKMTTEGLNRYGPRPLFVRMAITSGYCTVGNFGAENRLEYTIIGGPVNLVSKLQAQASPGEILVTDETRTLVHDRFEFGERGDFHVKGMQQPVRTHCVIAARTLTPSGGHISEQGEAFRFDVDFERLTPAEKMRLNELLKTGLSRLGNSASSDPRKPPPAPPDPE